MELSDIGTLRSAALYKQDSIVVHDEWPDVEPGDRSAQPIIYFGRR